MADRSERRRPAVLALLLLLGAAGTAAAAAITWWTQQHRDSLSGMVTTTATGSQLDPLLVPVAVLGLAGFGAALATRGVLRRVVGGLLAVGAAAAAVAAVVALVRTPVSLRTDLTRPAESSEPARLHAVGPLLGALGALLILAAGVLLMAGWGARRALGARYDAPTGARTAPRAGDPGSDADVSAGWWKALDAGDDPTGSAPGRSGDTGPGVSDGAIRGG